MSWMKIARALGLSSIGLDIPKDRLFSLAENMAHSLQREGFAVDVDAFVDIVLQTAGY
jgi:hypothetical protein